MNQGRVPLDWIDSFDHCFPIHDHDFNRIKGRFLVDGGVHAPVHKGKRVLADTEPLANEKRQRKTGRQAEVASATTGDIVSNGRCQTQCESDAQDNQDLGNRLHGIKHDGKLRRKIAFRAWCLRTIA